MKELYRLDIREYWPIEPLPTIVVKARSAYTLHSTTHVLNAIHTMPELLTSIHFQFLSPLHQFWDPLLSLTNKYGGGQSHTTLTSSTKSSSYQLIGYHSNYIQGKFGVQHCKLSIKQLIETHDVCSTCIHLYFSAVEHLLPELVGGKVYVFKYM